MFTHKYDICINATKDLFAALRNDAIDVDMIFFVVPYRPTTEMASAIGVNGQMRASYIVLCDHACFSLGIGSICTNTNVNRFTSIEHGLQIVQHIVTDIITRISAVSSLVGVDTDLYDVKVVLSSATDADMGLGSASPYGFVRSISGDIVDVLHITGKIDQTHALLRGAADEAVTIGVNTPQTNVTLSSALAQSMRMRSFVRATTGRYRFLNEFDDGIVGVIDNDTLGELDFVTDDDGW